MVVSLEEVPMHTITITLSDDRLAKLQEMAARLHISPEALALAGIEELLVPPEETCRRAVDETTKTSRIDVEIQRAIGICDAEACHTVHVKG
jgi:hypothetical protein